jgi:dihydrofolate reductase
MVSRVGAVVGGRWTYEAARHWGDENPWGLPFFIVTHRPEEEPAGGAFTFVSGVKEAVEQAAKAAGTRTSTSWEERTSSGSPSRPGSSTS